MIITSIIAMIAMLQTQNETRVENMNDASIHCASIENYDDATSCMIDAFNAYGNDDSMTQCENDEQFNCIFVGRINYNELTFIDVDSIAYYLTLNDRVIHV